MEKSLKMTFGLTKSNIESIDRILKYYDSCKQEIVWQKIGEEIGWESYTACRYYCSYLTKKLEEKIINKNNV